MIKRNLTEKEVDRLLGEKSEPDEIREEFEKELNYIAYRNYHGDLSSGDAVKKSYELGYKSASSRIAELEKELESERFALHLSGETISRLEEEVEHIKDIIQNFAELYHSMGDSGSLYVVNQICSAIESK